LQDPETIAAKLLDGDRLALSRLISWAENGDARFPASLARIYHRVGSGWRTGITGPPGAGKSTLVNELARRLRERGRTVSVLAIDPSSPYSGGALLGDRIRMEDRTKDAGVYIRSMASRDSHGGLARATVDACDVMDAFGFDELLIETVGVGQAEYDVVGAADTVLVVLCPGAGDGIQAMKAGLLEVADVLVVNKADLEGADRLVLDLEEAVHTRDVRHDDWAVPVVTASAARGEGTDEVLDAVDRHRAHVRDLGLEDLRRARRVHQVRRVVEERLEEELWGARGFTQRVETALAGEATPYDVAGEILDAILGGDLGVRAGGPESETARR
jgi:LAO/AO transport system kinase